MPLSTAPRTKHLIHVLAFALLTVVFTLAGCDTLDETVPEAPAASSDGSKFRHGDLLSQSFRTAGKGGAPTIGLILGIEGDKLQRQKVLARYKVLSRYKVLARYEYDEVIDGAAILVEDKDGIGFEELFQTLAGDPEVTWFEPDIVIRTDNPNKGSSSDRAEIVPWGHRALGEEEGELRHPEEVSLYVLDTGVSNRRVNVVESVDFVHGDPVGAVDRDGHGTHIAGTAAARRSDDGVTGIAPGVQVHSLKVVNDDDGLTDLSTAIAAVEHLTVAKLANPNAPFVVNISLGADIGTTAYNALDEAIRTSIQNGIVYVISAGNEGIDASTVTPAHVVEAITVGAYGRDYRYATFSNYGSVVDLLAPGADILSLDTDADGVEEWAVSMSGTSMAAAYTSGAVARFLVRFPYSSPQQVRDGLVNTGRDYVVKPPPQTTGRSVYLGPDGFPSLDVPPFLQYAISAREDVEFERGADIAFEGDAPVNANVFSNKKLKIDVKRGPGVTVAGFGYGGGGFDIKNAGANSFQPRYNPTRLPGTQHVGGIDVPQFDPKDYKHLATRFSSGEERLSGSYRLGTPEAPVVWYIDGKLKTEGDVVFSGYGIVMVKDDIEIEHDLRTEGGPGETALALYGGKQLKLKKEGTIQLSAQLLLRDDVVIEGNCELIGSITTSGKFVVKEGNDGAEVFRLRYRPAASELTRIFWPLGGTR